MPAVGVQIAQSFDADSISGNARVSQRRVAERPLSTQRLQGQLALPLVGAAQLDGGKAKHTADCPPVAREALGSSRHPMRRAPRVVAALRAEQRVAPVRSQT